MAAIKLNNVTALSETGGVATFGSQSSTLKYPTGMIINYVSQITTISGGQDLTDSYDEINGSSISYTPPAGASFVIYEFNFIMSGADSRFIGHFNLENNSVKVNSSTFGIDNENSGTSRGTDMINIKHKLAVWSGAQTVRLVGRRYSSAFDPKLHQTYLLDGSATDTYYDPTLNIFSVT